MKIITAGITDSRLVAGFVAALLKELSDGGHYDPDDLLELTADLLAREEVVGLLAFEGDLPLGLIMLNQCAAIYAGGLFGEITELYVVPDKRSNGVAQKLLLAARDLGRARGWKRLEVGAPNQPQWQRSLQFYQREGFLVTGPRLRQLL